MLVCIDTTAELRCSFGSHRCRATAALIFSVISSPTRSSPQIYRFIIEYGLTENNWPEMEVVVGNKDSDSTLHKLLITIRKRQNKDLSEPPLTGGVEYGGLSLSGFPLSRMPDSPDSVKTAPITPGVIPTSVNHLKVSSTLPGVNGLSHSPHSSSPSPSSPRPAAPTTPGSTGGVGLHNSAAAPALVAELGGDRQLAKLKRFLATLQQFGADISPEAGERVHTLILGLVSSNISIEEFHLKVQEATNYPMRPFVVPLLKSHLPLLQAEVGHFARMAKQTPQQYVRQHEQVLLDLNGSRGHHPNGVHNGGNSSSSSSAPLPSATLPEPFDIFPDSKEAVLKRRTPSDGRPKENGYGDKIGIRENSNDGGPPPTKRRSNLSSPNGAPGLLTTASSGANPGNGTSRLTPTGTNHIPPVALNFRFEESSFYRERERERFERYERYERNLHREFTEEREMEDEWKNIHTMLSCILGMVEKTKRALAILQHRSQSERQEMAFWSNSVGSRRHLTPTGDASPADRSEFDVKKRASDLMAHYKTAEDRVTEVRRRAEEAVNEVKRQAVAELQKAVSAAETKASELVATERAKMERLLGEARRQAAEEALATANQQDETSEVSRPQSCWNCGRKANETCSGCNVARYCGAFCQHKDWENHHRVCGQGGTGSSASSTSGLAAPGISVPSSTSPPNVPSSTSNTPTPSVGPPSGPPVPQPGLSPTQHPVKRSPSPINHPIVKSTTEVKH